MSGIDYAETLKAYFFRNGPNKDVFHRLCELERAYYGKDMEEELEPHFQTRTEICKQILGDTPIYKLYPEADARGIFEGNYDDMIWRENFYFGVPIKGSDLSREIDTENPMYQTYRQTLYADTIEKICEKYATYIYIEGLSSEEKGFIKHHYHYPSIHTGRWKAVIIEPGATYGREHLIRNEGERLVEFYDCTADQSKFPAGQFVGRYYMKTLCKDGELKNIASKNGTFSLDLEVPSWSIVGIDLQQIADWLNKKYQEPDFVPFKKEQLSGCLNGRREDKKSNCR